MDILTGSAAKDYEGGVWYSPDFENNRELDEPAEVLITPLSGAELLKLEHGNLSTRIDRKSKDFLGMVEQRQHALKMKALEDHVLDLRNWKAAGEPINSFKELKKICLNSKNAVLLGILNDIYNALLDASVLEEGVAQD